MKNGKKPTVAQRILLKEWRLNWENWLVTKDTPDEMWIVHRLSGKQRRIKKQ